MDELLCRYRGCEERADPRSLAAPPESEVATGAMAVPLCPAHFDLIMWAALHPGFGRVDLAGHGREVTVSVNLLQTR